MSRIPRQPGNLRRTVHRLKQPRAEVVSHGDMHVLYGWNEVISVFDGTFGQTVPARQCLGIYCWRWTAQIAKWRWLRKHHTR